MALQLTAALTLAALVAGAAAWNQNNDGDVQLINSGSQSKGLVQVWSGSQNTWVSVCDYALTVNNAKVICSQLTFQTANVSWSDWIVYKNSSTNPGWWNATTYPGPPQQFFTCSGSEPSVNNCPNYAFVPTVGCVAAAVSCPGVQYGTPNQVNHPGAATAASPALLLHAALAMLALALAVLMS